MTNFHRNTKRFINTVFILLLFVSSTCLTLWSKTRKLNVCYGEFKITRIASFCNKSSTIESMRKEIFMYEPVICDGCGSCKGEFTFEKSESNLCWEIHENMQEVIFCFPVFPNFPSHLKKKIYEEI